MKHYFQAEQLKYRHTSVAAITLGMPMFTALLAFWLTSSYFSVDVYNWWYIGLYPGFWAFCAASSGKRTNRKRITRYGHCPAAWNRSGTQKSLSE